MLKNIGSRRHKLDIYFDILDVTIEEALVTHIAGNANLNLGLVHEYLEYLISKGLMIEKQNVWSRKTMYITSDKGREFIDHYEALLKLIGKGS